MGADVARGDILDHSRAGGGTVGDPKFAVMAIAVGAEKSLSPTGVRVNGLTGPSELWRTIVVPASVPSDFHNCVPNGPGSSAVKNNMPSSAVSSWT